MSPVSRMFTWICQLWFESDMASFLADKVSREWAHKQLELSTQLEWQWAQLLNVLTKADFCNTTHSGEQGCLGPWQKEVRSKLGLQDAQLLGGQLGCLQHSGREHWRPRAQFCPAEPETEHQKGRQSGQEEGSQQEHALWRPKVRGRVRTKRRKPPCTDYLFVFLF